MNKIIRFTKEDTVLVVIDVQEKLMPAMYNSQAVEAQTIKLCKGLDVFGVPKIVTTQYSKGLGATLSTVKEALGQHQEFDKFTFSAYKDEAFKAALEETGRKKVVLVGVETHVCVEQTALDLVEAGYDVALCADCVSSRTNESIQTAFRCMEKAGVVITCGESVLFDILGSAKAPDFKAISAIVK
ncbi:MAG: hydrolase [Firmicutes bacterium]|nr:hydrolase [Bacillota bacterium]